jgi:hypothetical protein
MEFSHELRRALADGHYSLDGVMPASLGTATVEGTLTCS